MNSLKLLWVALGLTTAGFLLMWWGALNAQLVAWVGLGSFILGMLLGPLTRVVTRDENE